MCRSNTGTSVKSDEKENDKDDSCSVASLNAQQQNCAAYSSNAAQSTSQSNMQCRSTTEPLAKSYASLIDTHLATIVKEYRTEKQRKKRGWVNVTLLPGIIRQTGTAVNNEASNGPNGDGSPTLAYKKIGSECPCAQDSELNLWRSAIVLDESVDTLYNLLWNEQDWNNAVNDWHTLTQLDQSSDVVKFRKNDTFCGGRPDDNGQLATVKDYCVVRHAMRNASKPGAGPSSALALLNLKKDLAVYLCTSVHESTLNDPGNSSYNDNQVAWMFERCFVLEPLSGNLPHPRTLVTLFWREDVRGKTADWYMRFWPQQCYLELLRLKQYLLKHSARGGK